MHIPEGCSVLNWLLHGSASALSDVKLIQDHIDLLLSCGLRAVANITSAQEHPQLLPLIQRKFRSAGDVDAAQRLVFDSRGLERARELAAQHARLAVRAVRLLRLKTFFPQKICASKGSAFHGDGQRVCSLRLRSCLQDAAACCACGDDVGKK